MPGRRASENSALRWSSESSQSDENGDDHLQLLTRRDSGNSTMQLECREEKGIYRKSKVLWVRLRKNKKEQGSKSEHISFDAMSILRNLDVNS